MLITLHAWTFRSVPMLFYRAEAVFLMMKLVNVCTLSRRLQMGLGPHVEKVNNLMKEVKSEKI